MGNTTRADAQKILVFTMDEPRYALELSAVERVVQAAPIMPLPKAPPLVVGVINVQGQILPAVDIRPCLGLPLHDVNLNDTQALICDLDQIRPFDFEQTLDATRAHGPESDLA